jgi:putative hemolysin
VRRGDGSWLVDGTVPTDEVEVVTGIDFGRELRMLAGFVLDHLGRIAKPGMSFHYNNARYEVVDVPGNRIDMVIIGAERDDAEPRLSIS